MPEIVKIIAPTAFDYSHDNGVTLLRYEPGQIYEVPDSSIEGLRRRKAIEILDRKAIDAELSQAVPAAGDALVGEGTESGDADDGDEEDDEDAEQKAKAQAKEEAEQKAKATPAKSSVPNKPAK